MAQQSLEGRMSMPKKSTPETRKRLRQEFYKKLNEEESEFDLLPTIKLLRRIAGMTQTEYARLCKVDPRRLMDFERGVGNPTLSTIEALLKPFNLKLQVGLKRSLD